MCWKWGVTGTYWKSCWASLSLGTQIGRTWLITPTHPQPSSCLEIGIEGEDFLGDMKKKWPVSNILPLACPLFFLSNFLPTGEDTGSCTPIPQSKISYSATLTQTCILSVIRILIFHCWDHRSELIASMPLGKGGDWELLSSLGRFCQPWGGRTWNRRMSCVLKLVKYFPEEGFSIGKCWFKITKCALGMFWFHWTFSFASDGTEGEM